MEDNKTYALRDLTADDLFPMLDILKNIGIKEVASAFESPDIVGVLKKGKGKKDSAEVKEIGLKVGLEIGQIVIGNMGACKKPLYELLSGLSGLKTEEIGKLPMKTFIGMIADVFKKDEFADFFMQASKLAE